MARPAWHGEDLMVLVLVMESLCVTYLLVL
jgi:hypothetical protein